MLKVVGASWLQTRISTYILVAVGLLGIGAILLGEFGSFEKDGTYSATVFWNHKGGYRIDFWGQGNDLASLPRGVARAYYKTRIEETGWSIVEVETSPSYPDAVQAYGAGLLEGSLTWQVILHHWHNTIGAICSLDENEQLCFAIRKQLRRNTDVIRERAKLLASEDPYWHMVRLFYSQLDGLEAGWRFAVRRSRRSADIIPEDFIWLAMASDLSQIIYENKFNTEDTFMDTLDGSSTENRNSENGVIFVKTLDRSGEGLEPLVAFAQNTVAPYAKMLRLLKRYTFGYHVSVGRHSARVPTKSIFMSSYPGALSSHDEYYVLRGGKDKEDLMVLAAIPMKKSSPSPTISPSASTPAPQQDLETNEKGQEEEEQRRSIINIQGVMLPVRIMAASRLSTEARSWSKLLARGNPSEVADESLSNSLQWLTLKPKDRSMWLIEQHSATINAVDRTEAFRKNGFAFVDGESIIAKTADQQVVIDDHEAITRRFFAENITSVEEIRNLMRGATRVIDDAKNSKLAMNETLNDTSSAIENPESPNASSIDYSQKFVFRADLEVPARPIGTIDNKMTLLTSDGIESFEATSGPPFGYETSGRRAEPFEWSQYFLNRTHIGQPDKFEFDTVIPQWIWF